jgi:hypothetical protein
MALAWGTDGRWFERGRRDLFAKGGSLYPRGLLTLASDDEGHAAVAGEQRQRRRDPRRC